MNAAHAFGVTTKPVSLQNLLEIRRILCLPRGSLLLGGKPRVIAGTGNTRDLTQLGYCENIVRIFDFSTLVSRMMPNLKLLSSILRYPNPRFPAAA